MHACIEIRFTDSDCPLMGIPFNMSHCCNVNEMDDYLNYLYVPYTNDLTRTICENKLHEGRLLTIQVCFIQHSLMSVCKNTFICYLLEFCFTFAPFQSLIRFGSVMMSSPATRCYSFWK